MRLVLMRRSIWSLKVALVLLNLSVNAEASESERKETKVGVTVHNVGKGQCYEVELYDKQKKKSRSLLIGFGIEDSVPESGFGSKEEERHPARSQSLLRPEDYDPVQDVPVIRQELIRELKRKYQNDRGGISIDDVILTSPLQDSGLIMQLFHQEEDQIGHVWITGLPEQYYSDRGEVFRLWLLEKQAKGAEIDFFTVESANGKSVFEEKNRRYLKSWHTKDVKQGEEFLNWGDLKVSLLAVNPCHVKGHGSKEWGIENAQTLLRLCFPEDVNSDSLLIKITNGLSSILLAGNATHLTTLRALNNYVDSPKSLQATVLVASQGGSTRQGANSADFLKVVSPECILLSQGIRPTLDQACYETFLDAPRLWKKSKPHEILVQEPKVQSYETTTGIFSTLTSGTIRLDLYKKRFTLQTQKEGDVLSFSAAEKKGNPSERSPIKPLLERSRSVSVSPSVEKKEKVMKNLVPSHPRSVPNSPQPQRTKAKRTKSMASPSLKISKEGIVEKAGLSSSHQPMTLQRTRSTTSSPKVVREKATRDVSTSPTKSSKSVPNSPITKKKKEKHIRSVPSSITSSNKIKNKKTKNLISNINEDVNSQEIKEKNEDLGRKTLKKILEKNSESTHSESESS